MGLCAAGHDGTCVVTDAGCAASSGCRTLGPCAAGLDGKCVARGHALTRVMVAGFCEARDVLKVVDARQGGIKDCYEKELARNPELQGQVTMTWRLGLDGKVASVIVESSTLGSKEVEGCMRRNIERWVFPKPKGGLCQIRFPYVFKAGR